MTKRRRASPRTRTENLEISLKTVKGKRFWFLDGDPPVMALVKRVFPKAQVEKSVPSRFTKNPLILSDVPRNAMDLKLVLARHPAIMTPEDTAHLEQTVANYKAREARLLEFEEGSDGDLSLVNLWVTKTPHWFQTENVALIGAVNRLLVADEMGLGKTLTGEMACLLRGGLPALVSAPTHLKSQWDYRISQDTVGLTTQVLTGTKPYPLKDVDVYITSHNLLPAWGEDLMEAGIRTLVLDEVHEFRHLGTRKREAAALLSETAHRVVGLSGTPIYNFANEVYSVIDLIDPGALGTLNEFEAEYGKYVSDPKRLGQFLRDHGLMIRHTVEEAGIHAGDTLLDTVTVDAALEELARIEKHAIALAKRALTADFHDSGQAAREFNLLLRQATGAAKALAVAEFTENLLQSGAPKVLLFAWHREVYARLLHALRQYDPVMYTGSETPAKKAEALRRFKTDPKARVLLMSLRAGEGVDGLQQVCNHVVFGELDWSPARHAQCVARLARPGQTKPVYGYFITINDGSDPVMVDLLGLKKGARDAVIDLVDEQAEEPVGKMQELAARFLEQRKATTFGDGGLKVPPSHEAAELAAWLQTLTLTGYKDEKALQDGLEAKFEKAGRVARREVVLAPGHIIDFMVGDVGIEVKVQGDRAEVYRQVMRYSQYVREIILLCPWPLANFSVNGKPVHVVCFNNNARSLV